MILSPETIDGLLFELSLSCNPKVRERLAAFNARRDAFAKASAEKTRAEMIAELKSNHPAYLVDVLEREPIECLRSRYVHTFMPKAPK